MAARAKNRKKKPLNISSLASGLISKWFHRLFLLSPFTKIAKMILLCWTKWSPELKIEKPLNDISVASGQISK